MRRFALEVDVRLWQRGLFMIAVAMLEGFFLLPVAALRVIKDVGDRAGFLRDGLYGLQVLRGRSQGYRSDGARRG